MMNFMLPNENGVIISTNQFRGSILLLDFWASWCEPCRKQIPEITKVFEKYKNKNFKILSISLDKDKNKWLSASAKEKIQWDNVLEVEEFSSCILKGYEVNTIPATFLIDLDGIIIAENPTIQELDNYLIENVK
ncbi:Thiol-disulfide oxidoreductase ResA [Flavobacterium collinsii]|uniref:Thiol-disulfide oxidoreductase ResA n=2 Tax=Flavobacterium collinsii TaxID=1114861 RepID=A0ABN7EMP9_9FLAO|nr:Thiol-disulfide oxidoreductase ResA [Flavobacterium collinsii]